MTRFLKNRVYQGHRGWIIAFVFIVLALFIVATSYYGNKALSGLQVFVAGEGQWHKAQKEAVISLLMYNTYQDSRHYEIFQQHLEVLEGYSQGREAMLLDDSDLEAAYAGFSQASHDADDIELALWLFDNFRHVSHMQEILGLWNEKDTEIKDLGQLAAEMHRIIQEGDLSNELEREYNLKIYNRNKELARKGDVFRARLEQASDWIHNRIVWVTVSCGLILALIGTVVALSLFRKMNRLNQELADSRARLNGVLNHSRDVLYQLNRSTGDYEYVSPYVEIMLGYSAEEIMKRGTTFIRERMYPEDIEELGSELKQMEDCELEGHFATETEFRIRDRNDNYIWANNQRSLLRDEEGRPYAIVGSLRDITGKKQRQLQLDKSLQQKKVLLEEIHHRVKNNLTIVSSLIELQKAEVSRDIQAIFSDIQSRIQTIALIHEKLYQSRTLSDINMREYIAELADAISCTYGSRYNQIALTTYLDELSLEITNAIPLGLILNELLNNAYKHAFTGLPNGQLRVQLKQKKDGRVMLSVSDNGVGLPEGFDLDETHSLGMTLVKTFAQQIEANFYVSQNRGTIFRVEFEVPENLQL